MTKTSGEEGKAMELIGRGQKQIKVVGFSQEVLMHQMDPVACNANFRGGLGRLMRCFLHGLKQSNLNYRCCIPLHAHPWKDPESGPIGYDEYGPVIHSEKLSIDQREITVTARALFGEGQVLGIECPPILDVLYNDNRRMRWLQEVVFTRGAVGALAAQGFIPDVAWINDTHPALAAAHLQAFVNPDLKVLYTTHTQQGAARERYYGPEWRWEETGLPEHYLPIFIPEPGVCDFSHAICTMAHVINAVSLEHEEVTRRSVYPAFSAKTTSVTNHVSNLWQMPAFQAHASDCFASLTDEGMLAIHQEGKERFLSMAECYAGCEQGVFDRKKLWGGMIRRPAAYKNMYELIRKILPAICADRGQMVMTECGELEGLGIGLVIAFLPPSNDGICRSWMEGYIALSPYHQNKLVYIPDYSFELVDAGVSGADFWLEIPLLGQEGCGTSGQQAARNGIPTISTMGGGNIEWMREFDPDTGEGNGLYMKLDTDPLSLYGAMKKISDLYYAHRDEGDMSYLHLMRNVLVMGESLDVRYVIKKYERIFEHVTTPIFRPDALAA